LTLHVGAGTFLPLKTVNALDHDMHAETFFVKRECLEKLIRHAGNIASVGTTSLRTLESLHWMGAKIIGNKAKPLEIEQFEYIDLSQQVSFRESLAALTDYMVKNKLSTICCHTRIMIVPGYQFKAVNRLITNFHQPKSTLLLLVAAFIGDEWKGIYNYALKENYRFLSYGDSSLLERK
jgi:S-adenosylmethionine:tRNA ribosyltransferase-isomerase